MQSTMNDIWSGASAKIERISRLGKQVNTYSGTTIKMDDGQTIQLHVPRRANELTYPVSAMYQFVPR